MEWGRSANMDGNGIFSYGDEKQTERRGGWLNGSWMM